MIPAGDLAGQWLVGVDGKGHLRRLRDRAVLEDVSDRYGLRSGVISDLAAADVATATVFALENELAVADGKTSFAIQSSCGTCKAAADEWWAFPTAPRLRSSRAVASSKRFGLPQAAVATVIDNGGPGGDCDQRLRCIASRVASWARRSMCFMCRRMRRFWVWRSRAARCGYRWAMPWRFGQRCDPKSPPLALPADAKLFGSPTGDVWVLSSGMLRRFGEDSGGGADEEVWRQTVQPVFTRLCALCHMPGQRQPGSVDVQIVGHSPRGDQAASDRRKTNAHAAQRCGHADAR